MPAYCVKQSSTAYPLVFLMVQSSDHITGLTSASPTVTISKSGAAFGSPSGAVTEIGSGWYKVAGNATDSGTLGPLALHATAASGDPTDQLYEVVANDPQDAVHYGLSALPNTACTTNASLLTSGTGTDQVSVSSGKVLLQATQSGVTIPTVTTVTNQLTAAAIATGVWQDTTAGDFTTASSIGKSLYTGGVVPGGTNGLFIAGTNAATVITTSLTTHFIGTVDTVTTVTNQLTAAAVATGVWQDATAGDFTTASSIGKSLYTTGAVPGAAGGLFIAGTNAATTVTTSFTTTFTGNLTGSVGSVTGAVGSVTGAVGSVTGSVGSVVGAVGSVTGLTTATIATAVWTDTTAGDFTTSTSPGKIIFTQLGGTFTTTSSSIFSTASLVNAPTAPTAAAVATAVWQDATAGDFTTASSIGKSLYTAGAVPGAAGGLFIAGTNAATTANITGNITGNLSGSVGSVTAGVTVTTNNDKTGYSLSQSFPSNFAALGITAGGKISGVVLADTLTTYTGDTPQTGDSFARIGATGSGLTSLAPSATALSTAQWSNTRAGYLDNLSGGAVALASGVTLTSAGLNSVVIETGLNARQAISIIAAACAGAATGVSTGSPVYKGAGVATTRIVATASSGDRSSVILTPPA